MQARLGNKFWRLGLRWALDTWTKLKTKNKNNPDGERDRGSVSRTGAMANQDPGGVYGVNWKDERMKGRKSE